MDFVSDRDLVAEARLALKMAPGGTAAWRLAVELGARRPIFAALVPLVGVQLRQLLADLRGLDG